MFPMMVTKNDMLAMVQSLYDQYNHCLDGKDLLSWPNYFTDDGLYRVTTKQNTDNDWPLSLVLCEGKNMLEDRARILSGSVFFRDRTQQRLTTGIGILGNGIRHGDENVFSTTSLFAINESLCGQGSRLLVCGKTQDEIIYADDRLRFKKRVFVIDADVIEDSVVYPI